MARRLGSISSGGRPLSPAKAERDPLEGKKAPRVVGRFAPGVPWFDRRRSVGRRTDRSPTPDVQPNEDTRHPLEWARVG